MNIDWGRIFILEIHTFQRGRGETRHCNDYCTKLFHHRANVGDKPRRYETTFPQSLCPVGA